jgi:hypothetical protein
MEDKELKLVEVEASHTLGGSGEGRMLGRGKWRGCRCYSVVRYTKQTRLIMIIVSLAENSGRMPGVELRNPRKLRSCVSPDLTKGIGCTARTAVF